MGGRSGRSAGSGAIGLVPARPARLLGVEPFFMEFVSGIEETLVGRDMSVLLHVVTSQEAEIAAYRRWAGRDLVDAVVVVNLVSGDRRPAVLRELDLPTVLAGDRYEGDAAMASVRTDHVAPVREALAYLLELGHRRIARITGPALLLHTAARTRALLEGARAAGVEPVIVEGDYSEESGAALTAELLARPEPPTAIVYDNDVMALAGLRAARDAGVAVPAEVSLLAWDDSPLCRLSSPPLTAMMVDVHQFGVSVADSVLEVIDGRPVRERSSPTARLVARGSTGPAPGGG